jgi:hypothetical protein
MSYGSYRFWPLLLVVLALITPARAQGDVLDQPLHFDRGDLHVSPADGFDRIHLTGADLTLTPGEPELPVSIVHLALPGRAVVDAVELVDARWVALPGTYRVPPVQEPFVLSHEELGLPGPTETPPAARIYGADDWYPAAPAVFSGDGFLAGVHVAGVRIHPVRYAPLSRRLELCESALLRVHYHEEPSSARFRRAAELPEQGMRELAARLVANPSALANTEVKMATARNSLRSGESYDYLIVCTAEFAPYFEPLVQWKTRKGLRVKVETVEEINLAYPGMSELSARVRQAIVDAYANWGITYVLLGGDSDIVGFRDCFAMDSHTFPLGRDRIPADLYFSDLDGDWNANGVAPFGEVADDVDLYADVILGRFPVRNTNQVAKMVSKLLTYEKNPPLDYETEMLLTGEILWHDPYTDSGISLSYIGDNFTPARFHPIQKLYESLGNESKYSVINALNSGQNFWLHDGHGNTNLMSVGSGTLYDSDMTELTNAPRFTLCYSVACLSGGFDIPDCIAERWVRNLNGGGIAFVGNARYGWGSPGNPMYGYSDRLQHRFFETLFVNGEYQPGKILALVKAHYAPQSQSENVYRWHQYSVNLLGEPEFSLWTDTPGDLTVAHAASHPLASGSFPVTVTDDGMPVANALVCVTDDATLHEAGRTDANGQVVFTISPLTTDALHVTVTAPDYLPYEGECSVLPSGPYAALAGLVIDDGSGGDGNGLLNAGESADLVVSLHNPGTETASGVTAILRSSDPLVTVADSVESYGDIAAGQTVSCLDCYSFTIDAAAAEGHTCLFELEVSAAVGGPWDLVVAVPVAAPVLDLAAVAVHDGAKGNGNNLLEPGESFSLAASFRNHGSDVATTTTVEVSTPSPYIAFSEPIAVLASAPPGGVQTGVFSGSALVGCPDPHFATLHFDLTTSNGYAFAESTLLVVGATGFADDLESGAGDWTHGGTNDLWHLTAGRTHSGTAAWYCGRQDSSLYEPDMAAQLTTPALILAPEPRLSFWLWHEVATYGVDGLYVVLTQGAAADTLDFIASGGALGTYVIGNDWLEFSYDLGFFGYEAGDEVELSFLFVSDDDANVAEGYYIDDVIVTGKLPAATTDVSDLGDELPRVTELLGNVPNPFPAQTTIRFATAQSGPVRLAVYDVRGRLVRTLLDRPLERGVHGAIWDGRSEQGMAAASGVYFARLEAAGVRRTSKLLFLR